MVSSVYKLGKRARVLRDVEGFVVEKKLDNTWVPVALYRGETASSDSLTHFQNIETVLTL